VLMASFVFPSSKLTMITFRPSRRWSRLVSLYDTLQLSNVAGISCSTELASGREAVTGMARTIEGTDIVDIHVSVGQALRRGGIRGESGPRSVSSGRLLGGEELEPSSRHASSSSSRTVRGAHPYGVQCSLLKR